MDIAQHANSAVARTMWLVILVLALVWILKYMGGVATSPEEVGPNKNDTSSLFNWHPLLMVLAFPVLMTEAILTYTATPLRVLPRLTKKVIHGTLQGTAMVLMVLSLVAVFRSHTQKKPEAMDNLYSIHSYLGICALAAFVFQFVGGAVSFVLPGMTPAMKKIYVPLHHFFGMAAYFIALATMLAGLQEKSTFNRHSGLHIHFHGSYEPLSVIPAVMGPLIIILATSVAFHATFLKPPPTEDPSPEGPSQQIQEPLVQPKETTEAA